MSSEPIVAFIAERAAEDGSPMSLSAKAVALLHTEAHGECWVCRYEDYPCTTLRLLASPWADHPGYQSGWKP